MPRLNVISPDQATGPLKQSYDDVTAKMGKVVNIGKGEPRSRVVSRLSKGEEGGVEFRSRDVCRHWELIQNAGKVSLSLSEPESERAISRMKVVPIER